MASTRIFGTTGGLQSWTVPANLGGGKVTLELVGAGCPADPSSGTFSKGGRVVGDLVVAPGDILYFYVGSSGVQNGGNPAYFGGGGRAGDYGKGRGAQAGYSGGGATTVYKNGTALANRVAVAGGAGGASAWWTTTDGGIIYPANGGNGGGTTGQAGSIGTQVAAAGGGTQTAGGARGNGSLGGGDGGSGNGGYGGPVNDGNYAAGGGGGGGYFGGGGGASAHFLGNQPGGGGGGSSYVGGLTGAITNTQGYFGATSNGKLVVTYEQTPNAPTISFPYSNWNFDYTTAIPVTWAFSDPDPGDVQAKADVQWRVGSGAWTTIANAVVGTGNTYTFAANTFAAYSGQQVELQVRTSDATGYGPWSASTFFSVWPTPPSFVFSATPVITSNTPPVAGARSDAGPMSAYRCRVLNDVAGAPGSTVLADSQLVTLPNPKPTDISFFAPNYAYVNGTSYHIQVLIDYPLWVDSAWTDSGALVANVNAPLQPTLVLTAFESTASVEVAITNPGSDPHQPSFNRLYRTDTTTGVEVLIQDNLAINATYVDYNCGFNRPYRYRVEAVTAGNAVTSSS